MKHKKLTIALLTYNRCKQGYLQEALDSILAQTYSDFDLIIADNHSTDNTTEVVLKYNDPRITYLRQAPGGNATTNYLKAAYLSQSEYILFAHDDDIMEPTMIEKQMQYVESDQTVELVTNNVHLIKPNGQLLQSALYDVSEDIVFHETEFVKRYFEEKMWLPAPTFLLKRERFIETVQSWPGAKEGHYVAGGDILLPLTLNLKGKVIFIAEPLLQYRQHTEQESRNIDQSSSMVEASEIFAKQFKSNSLLKPHLATITAFVTRFKAQELFFTATNKEELTAKLIALTDRWCKEIQVEHRAVDAIVPIEIAITLLGIKPTITLESLRTLVTSPAKSGGRKGFRLWLQKLMAGEGLFIQGQYQRIAILGSMLNSYLIAESARQAGIEVVTCFDSSPARIGKTVFDIPIIPLAEIYSQRSTFDLLILSSEHDQEDALRAIVQEHMGQNDSLEILSWKELLT